MNWLILASLAGLTSNGFNIVNRTALKNNGDYTAYAWWFECLRTAFFLALIFVGQIPSINLTNIPILMSVGVIEFFSIYLLMKMHAYSDLSVSSIIVRLRIVWTPLLAWLLLNERLNITEYFGIAIIFLGIFIVTSPKKIRADKGMKVAFIFSLVVTLLNVLMKSAINVSENNLVPIFQGIVPMVMLPVFMKNPIARIKKSLREKKSEIFLAAIFNIITAYLFFKALDQSDTSKVIGVYQSTVVFSIIYGIWILNEKDNIVGKLIGAFTLIVGILIMAI